MLRIYKKKWVIYDNGRIFNLKTGRELFGTIMKSNGYVYIHLDKKYRLHKLIAQLFISNPNNYPVIDHIDRNKLNNSASNLRWCTQSTNKRNASNNVKIICLETGKIYASEIECAEDLNCHPSNVYNALNLKRNQTKCKGFTLKKFNKE